MARVEGQVERAVAGDKAALEAVVLHLQNDIYRLSLRMLGKQRSTTPRRGSPAGPAFVSRRASHRVRRRALLCADTKRRELGRR